MFRSIPDIVWRDPTEGMSWAEREAYYDRVFPWRVGMRKARERRNARRAYAAQNSLWLAEYEDRMDRARERWLHATTRYLRGNRSVKVAHRQPRSGVAPDSDKGE